MSKEVYTTVEEAAELLGKSQATIRNWIKKEKLKAEAVEFSQRYGRNYYRYKTWFIFRNSLPRAREVEGNPRRHTRAIKS